MPGEVKSHLKTLGGFYVRMKPDWQDPNFTKNGICATSFCADGSVKISSCAVKSTDESWMNSFLNVRCNWFGCGCDRCLYSPRNNDDLKKEWLKKNEFNMFCNGTEQVCVNV